MVRSSIPTRHRWSAGLAAGGLAAVLAVPAGAATSTEIVLNPIYPLPTATIVGAPFDAAPGFDLGSIAANGGATKTEFYFPAADLFGRSVTLGEIASIRYWTKKGTTHAAEPRDWFLAIYTNPFPGDVSTPVWYGDRIGSEPYFSMSLNDPAGAWNQWSTDGADNRLRFFQSTQGAPGANFGSYSDPDWDTFVTGNSLGTASPLAGHTVLYFSLQTASAWSAGFTGQLDGFVVELDDGSTATVNFEPACTEDQGCDDGLFCTIDSCDTGTGLCSYGPRDCGADDVTGDFEAPGFSAGSIDGQQGWESNGSAGSGCAVYDHAVSPSLGTGGFGAQSLRISNAVTSSCFGDQTFSAPVANEVGETDAESGGLSGGSRRTRFVTEFDIASAVPGAEQPNLFFSTNADRGDGARMTWLGFADTPTGLEVRFFDYQDVAPFGADGSEGDGCDGADDFVQTVVATGLDRSVPHNIREVLTVVDGPRNDVVEVYVDDVLVHTGTSWEDYFRWCELHEASRTVDSRLFRTGGTAAPGTSGGGFLIDNLVLTSGDAEGSECNDTCDEDADACYSPAATACSDDGNPCTTDLCDGDGSCEHAAGNAGASCRASAGVCDVAETCDGSSTACPANAFASPTLPCRASAGACDVAESCTGSSATCPANGFAPANTTCGSDDNACTDDVCDGAGSCTHPTSSVCSTLDLDRGVVRVQKAGNGRGAARVRGSFLTLPPTDTFDLSSPITLLVEDNTAASETTTWAPADCTTRTSGKIKCLSPDKGSRAIFKPKAPAGTFLFSAKLGRRAIDAPVNGPITATLEYGEGPTSRTGQVSDCAKSAAGVRCK